MNSSRTLRTLCAVWTLVLLAAPTMALCLECVGGSCVEPTAVHGHGPKAEADVPVTAPAASSHGAMEHSKARNSSGAVSRESADAAMPAAHCDGVAAAPVPAPADTPVLAGDCCAAQAVLNSGEVATRAANSEFGKGLLTLSSAVAPAVPLRECRVDDRSAETTAPPPLYRLHASLLL